MDRIKFMIDSGSDIPPEVADALDGTADSFMASCWA